MTINHFRGLLENQGFLPADHVADFGAVLQNVLYMVRPQAGKHSYVSCMFYDNEFREAVVEHYRNKKNTRAKAKNGRKDFELAGGAPFEVAVVRSYEALQKEVARDAG